MREPIKVANYKRPREYVYCLAIGSKYVHLCIAKHIALCAKTIDAVGIVTQIDSVSEMCPKCVAKAGSNPQRRLR